MTAPFFLLDQAMHPHLLAFGSGGHSGEAGGTHRHRHLATAVFGLPLPDMLTKLWRVGYHGFGGFFIFADVILF